MGHTKNNMGVQWDHYFQNKNKIPNSYRPGRQKFLPKKEQASMGAKKMAPLIQLTVAKVLDSAFANMKSLDSELSSFLERPSVNSRAQKSKTLL